MASGVVVLEGRGLTKVYGSGPTAVQALRGVDIALTAGEMVVLLGPSGSGKSTLLNILGGLDVPTAGSVRFRDHDLTVDDEAARTRYRRDHVGFVFQFYNLVPSLTARENVALVNRMRGAPTKDALEEAQYLLDKVGLHGKGDKKPNMLSGGERQRVAIARALAGHPPIVLADEPTASLDATSGLVVTKLLKELSHELGTTVLVVTHDNRIFHLADRIVNIEDGLITDGTPEHA